jgi:hypothetical protein
MRQGNQEPRGDNSCEHCVFIAGIGNADYYACSHWNVIHALPRDNGAMMTPYSRGYRDLKANAKDTLDGMTAHERPFHIAYRRARVRGLV